MIKLNSVTKKINLDYVRLILSFFIIAIHTYPLSFLGDFQDYLFTRIIFRIAVPLYLMITGYYILKKSLKQKEVLINYLKKISTIYLSSIIIYSLFLIKNFHKIQALRLRCKSGSGAVFCLKDCRNVFRLSFFLADF